METDRLAGDRRSVGVLGPWRGIGIASCASIGPDLAWFPGSMGFDADHPSVAMHPR